MSNQLTDLQRSTLENQISDLCGKLKQLPTGFDREIGAVVTALTNLDKAIIEHEESDDVDPEAKFVIETLAEELFWLRVPTKE